MQNINWDATIDIKHKSRGYERQLLQVGHIWLEVSASVGIFGDGKSRPGAFWLLRCCWDCRERQERKRFNAGPDHGLRHVI